MSVDGAAPVRARSRPGTKVKTAEPGLNPSLRSYGAGSMAAPAAFVGIAWGWKSTCRPVAVEGSATVK